MNSRGAGKSEASESAPPVSTRKPEREAQFDAAVDWFLEKHDGLLARLAK